MKKVREQSSIHQIEEKAPSIYAQSQAELNDFLSLHNYSPFTGAIFFQHLYKNKINQEISPSLKSLLQKTFDFYLPQINKISSSLDGTVKFLLKLNDGHLVETVLLPFHKKYTVCLSSQVGCAMNCDFCYTGKMGLKRHLKAEEIIGQYIVAYDYLKKNIQKISPTPNIVFMGQGEPLHNVEEVKKAIEIFTERGGLGLGPRQITLSTAGYLPGLRKLSRFPQINIAVSLHSPFDDKRSQLIPINKHYPLETLFLELDKLELKKRQFITYEYLLIKDFNDGVEDALGLSHWLSSRKAIINLIPFNPFPGSHFKRPSSEEVESFKEKLVSLKLRTMVRKTNGSDVLAACGQLNTQDKNPQPIPSQQVF